MRCKEELENTFPTVVSDESISQTDETLAESPKKMFKVTIESVKKTEAAKSVKKVSKKKISKTVKNKNLSAEK